MRICPGPAFRVRRIMYRGTNYEDYEAPHIYRSITSIRQDMCEVREQIKEINSRLNIRNMLYELLSSAAESQPCEWVPELRELAEGAEESLSELRALSEVLTELSCELEETKRVMGI